VLKSYNIFTTIKTKFRYH